MERSGGNKGRTKRLSVRVSPEEFKRIIENAEGCGLPVAGYLRAAGTGELPRKKEHKKSALDSTQPLRKVLPLFKEFSLLSSLDEEELIKALDKISVKSYRKNEIALLQEDSNRFMYLILKGSVKVILVNEEGKEIILAMHRAGDFFGEMSLIDGRTASATVVTAEDCTIAIISKDNFYTLLFTEKKILLSLLNVFCHRIRTSNRTIEIMSHTSASYRIKTLLLMLCERHGEKAGSGTILSIQMTHQDIADMTGLTRETVTKVMNEMKEEGAISVLENRCIRLNRIFFTPASG